MEERGMSSHADLVRLSLHGRRGNAQLQRAAGTGIFLPSHGLALLRIGNNFQSQLHTVSVPDFPRCLATRSPYLINPPPNKSKALPTVASMVPPLKASISSIS